MELFIILVQLTGICCSALLAYRKGKLDGYKLGKNALIDVLQPKIDELAELGYEPGKLGMEVFLSKMAKTQQALCDHFWEPITVAEADRRLISYCCMVCAHCSAVTVPPPGRFQ